MVFEGRGFESISWFIRDVGLSPHLSFFGGGGSFFVNFVWFGWWWFDFDFLGDYFFKGNFFLCFVLEVYLDLWGKFIYICLTFTHSFTQFFLYCGEV